MCEALFNMCISFIVVMTLIEGDKENDLRGCTLFCSELLITAYLCHVMTPRKVC